MTEAAENQFEDLKIEKPSWRRWPIVFLFSLYGCHYSFQVSLYPRSPDGLGQTRRSQDLVYEQ